MTVPPPVLKWHAARPFNSSLSCHCLVTCRCGMRLCRHFISLSWPAPATAQANVPASYLRRLLPHFHPNGAEYFLGIKGKINLVVFVNQQLVRRSWACVCPFALQVNRGAYVTVAVHSETDSSSLSRKRQCWQHSTAVQCLSRKCC